MIQVNNLSKRYGSKEAVKNISFKVEKGEIVGFLGPNGAGKSTTMNVITGYLSASGGNAKIAGFDVLDDPIDARRHIGYLPEQPPLYQDMTVDEYLNFVFELKKAEGDKETHVSKICGLVGIEHVRRRIIRNLSKGYKQRVGLAQALIGDPDVLILDEPTVGLDPNQIIEIRNLIKNLGKDRTIILSTHIIPEVSAVCERVVVINEGVLVADDTVENLIQNVEGVKQYTARIDGTPEKVLETIRSVEGVTSVEEKGRTEDGMYDYLISTDADLDIRKPLFYALAQADCPLLNMSPVDVSLEAVFARLTKNNKGGDAK